MTDDTFHGAKLILFVGSRLLVLRRDDIPDIPFPNCLDFPGGGREDDEPPLTCALRETHEEVGLTIRPDQVVWRTRYSGALGVSWFFAGCVPASVERDIRLGDEGQSWLLISPGSYLTHPQAISHFAKILGGYLTSPQHVHL